MSFSDRIRRLPVALDREAGDAARATVGWDGEVGRLIAGAAGSSPFLASLVEREGDWVSDAMDAGPERAFEALLATLPGDPRDARAILRRAKRRTALLVALADLGGVWDLATVTGALTRFADEAVKTAIAAEFGRAVSRGKLDPQPGLVAIAMGKMGAGELNYSSDIDLIFLVNEARYASGGFAAARAALTTLVKGVVSILSDRDADGYVFRTDLRLRPDPGVTPVVLTMAAAERYYERMGRTWERAAHIKARAAAGDVAAGVAYLERLAPFVWRRYLDFAAIEDAHAMRLRIRRHKGLRGDALAGRDIKLASGGIREIEFFTQTHQLIAGGRDPALRARGTCAALDRLARAGWIAPADAATLTSAYEAHREVEHRLQMIHDAQTHCLPKDEPGFARLAALMGRAPGDVRAEIGARIAGVERLVEDLYPADAAPQPADEPDHEPAGLSDAVDRWQSTAAFRSERARAIFDRIRPQLARRIADAPDPDATLRHLGDFIAGQPAGVQLFSLFAANPQLLDLIVDISGAAPDLARYLGRHPRVLEAVLDGSFFAAWPGQTALTADLDRVLGSAGDYEDVLDAARRWAKERHFRIGVHHLRGLCDAVEAARQYADLAKAVLVALLPNVAAEIAGRHGDIEGRGAVILAMGSLGAGQLTAGSDLDLIVVYDAPHEAMSDGRRPLAPRPYFAKVAQALVTAISAPTAEGRLYEVDMRLRPSGRQGPVATSLRAFRRYQAEDAATWEHLALTRADAIAGEPALRDEIEAVRCAVLRASRPEDGVLADVAALRRRLFDAKPGGGPLDPKDGPGRLLDIELAAALGAFLSGATARTPRDQIAAATWLPRRDRDALRRHHGLFHRVQIARRLIGPDARPDLILRETGHRDADALADAMARAADEAAGIIEAGLTKVSAA